MDASGKPQHVRSLPKSFRIGRREEGGGRAPDTSRWLLCGLLLVATWLLLYNLGGECLWDDEAQTALISRSISLSGVPLGHDGRHSFSQELGAEFGDDRVYKWHPWLPFYLLAGFFRLFGEGTAVARLPFALVGVAACASTYLFAKQLFGKRSLALVSLALLVSSVPFLILVRQCRYYSLAIFLSSLGLYAYVTPKRRWLLGPTSVALFYTQNIYYVTLWGTLLLHAAWFHRKWLKELVLVAVGSTLLCLPWAWYARTISYKAVYPDILTWSQFVDFVRPYLAQVRARVLPLWVLALPVLAILISRFLPQLRAWLGSRSLFFLERDPIVPGEVLAAEAPAGEARRSAISLLGLYLVLSLLVLCGLSVAPMFRYLAPLIPVASLLAAALVAPLCDMHPVFAVVAVVAFAWQSRWHRFVYEITHAFRGPTCGMTAYLNAHAKPSDTVAITYGDLPLKFYTPFKIVGGLTGEDLALARDADWIIVRQEVNCSKDAAVKEYLEANIDWDNYRSIVLDAPDTLFENREDPAEHRFRTARGVANVVIRQRNFARAQR